MYKQKHPHVIFEAKTKPNKGCANLPRLKWEMANTQQTKHVAALVGEAAPTRYRRDVSEATKYIETAVVIDKGMVSMHFQYFEPGTERA
ncbi:Disintegrin and metalloproteinase domain-containing protein 22 [Homalodisca vitripennis]|nr:Disintegrin and metalloproteinase domain-containing protein 22 [Homalodisca vitripennis]